MGESDAKRWRALAYWHFARTRGKETLQAVEPWVKIAVLGAPAAHYLGLSAWWSVVLGLGIIVGSELAMLILGWFDHRQGVIVAQQQWSNEQDVVKMETLRALQAILREVQALRGTQGQAHTLHGVPGATPVSTESFGGADMASRLQSL